MVKKEYIQVKFHQFQSDTITLDNLMDPTFIGATSSSFLQKLRDAYRQLGQEYFSCLFTLYSPFDIDQNDILYSMISNKYNMIAVNKLIDGTKRTKQAKCRDKLMQHLNVSAAELKIILSQVRFYKGLRFPELLDHINTRLAVNNLKAISNATVQNPYLSLAKNWFEGNHEEINSEFVRSECKSENLLQTKERKAATFAVKTFLKDTQYLSDKGIETLDLSGCFDKGKYKKLECSWLELCTRIHDFGERRDVDSIYEIHLQCSLSVSFLTGRIYNPKSGLSIYPIQKTADGLKAWDFSRDEDVEALDNMILLEEKSINDEHSDNVVIISITHDIERDVMDFLGTEGIGVSKIYHLKHHQPGQYAITNGQQCAIIAEYMASVLGQRRREDKMQVTHVFVSAPVSLMFYFGKYSLNLGKITLYEHDMTYLEEKTYCKSIELPMEGE